MGYEQQFKYMVANDVDPRTILATCKSKYRDLFDAGKWGPANHAKDSKAMDKNFGKVHMVENTEAGIKNYVNQLVQGQINRDKSKDTCNTCGKKGHWSNACPQKKGRRNMR